MNNVNRVSLWETIKNRRLEIQHHRIQSWRPETFDSYPCLEVNYLDKQWLSECISTEDLKSMSPDRPKLIVAQTGSGKSFMVMSKVLPLAMAANKKILYLCSRTALALKVIEDSMRDPVNGEVYCGKRKVKEFSKIYTPEGLKDKINFGYVDVVLYQHWIRHLDDFVASNYEYIVADEIHLLSSDSGFLVQSYQILSALVDKFSNNKRIMITATPDECIQHIWREETKNNCNKLPHNQTILDVYSMQEDYSYLIPKFFNTQYELVDLVKQNSDKLWIIFVDNKEIGAELQDALSEGIFRPLFFTSESDKNSEEFMKMIKNEKIPHRICISTSVLDVGINLRDKDFNIAIFSNDVVQIKQCLGRKRLNSADERVNAYFKVPSNKELSVRKRLLSKRIGEINQVLHAINNNEYIDSIVPPFGIKGSEVYYNPLCMCKLESDLKHIEFLIEELSSYDTLDERSFAYAKILLSNFDGVEYEEESLLVEPKGVRLKSLLMSYIGKTFGKEEFAKLAEEFKSIMGEVRSHPRPGGPGVSSINSCIEKYGFTITSTGSPVQYSVEKVGE